MLRLFFGQWKGLERLLKRLWRHSGIELFGIDFGSLKGNNVVDPNNGSALTLVEEASGDEEEGGSNVANDVKEVHDPQSVLEETTKDPSHVHANVPLPFFRELVPPLFCR